MALNKENEEEEEEEKEESLRMHKKLTVGVIAMDVRGRVRTCFIQHDKSDIIFNLLTFHYIQNSYF